VASVTRRRPAPAALRLTLKSAGGKLLAATAIGKSFTSGFETGSRAMSKEEVLAKLAAGELTVEQASQMLADAEPKRGTLYCKVSEKGAISVYGLQRMPVTLYVEQWQRLLDYSDEIRGFMKENDAKLKRKER
jgi:hypothetical protein